MAGAVAPGALAADRDVERLVHRPGRATVAPRAAKAPQGLTPAAVKAAYNFPSGRSAGSGATIAVVVPFDHPRIEDDLGVFSATFGLPACTTANGCFRKVNATGGTDYPGRSKLWALETALDVEWAHAIAPGAKILLVEAAHDGLSAIMAAEDYATAHAGYVSNSFGIDEFAGQSALDHHFDRPGVSIFVATGDEGAAPGVSYPASAPGVVAVGGTTLVDAGKPTFAELAWKGSGGGCSRFETAHPAQRAFAGYAAVGCAGRRAVPDVSLVADPRNGVAIYSSYKASKPWMVIGGTSASAPMWAGRAAASGLVVKADRLYSPTSPIAFRDITKGSNGFSAGPGFDLVTGLGSWVG